MIAMTAMTAMTTMKKAPHDPMKLCFEDIAIELGGRLILDEIDFEVSPGEVVGLVGRNGVGKTTLLRLASGRVSVASPYTAPCISMTVM